MDNGNWGRWRLHHHTSNCLRVGYCHGQVGTSFHVRCHFCRSTVSETGKIRSRSFMYQTNSTDSGKLYGEEIFQTHCNHNSRLCKGNEIQIFIYNLHFNPMELLAEECIGPPPPTPSRCLPENTFYTLFSSSFKSLKMRNI